MSLEILCGQEHIGDEFEQDNYVIGGVSDFIFFEQVHHEGQINGRFYVVANNPHNFLSDDFDFINLFLFDIYETHDDMMQMFLYVFLGDQDDIFELLKML